MGSMVRAGLAAALVTLVVSGSAGAIPYGTYQQSCKDIKLKGRDSDSARVQARCLDSKGEWRKTSFELDRCWGDLANIDGELVCVADQRHGGGRGFRPAYPGQDYSAYATPDYHPPVNEPKGVAIDVCADWAVRQAYQEGAGYARLQKIEDVNRKDEGRIKVKGIVLSSRAREDRKSKELPFRCDSQAGRVVGFKWR